MGPILSIGVRPLIVAAAACCALTAAASASAATVRTEEDLGAPTSFPQRSTLFFESTPGEQNGVTVQIASASPIEVTYVVTDSGSALIAGPGCTGGGAPDVAATCRLQPSRPARCVRTFCVDGGRSVTLKFGLGDGADSLDSSTVASDDGGGVFLLAVFGDTGADRVVTGPTADSIDPGPGADTVATGDGSDRVTAAVSAPDGADLLDLGAGLDSISYGAEASGVSISSNGVADDGAPAEGDNVSSAENLVGGSGDDRLIGVDQPTTPSTLGENLAGGPGDDTLFGNGGDDYIDGGLGDDRSAGGAGDDWLAEAFSGRDRARGGPGDDGIFGGPGADHLLGGPGRDAIFGEGGSDELLGGTGADLLNSRDNDTRDRVDCGAAKDRVRAEPIDRVRRCEL